ncbi:hypothetical protein V5799_022882, partial [Amblyomma americanum]
VLSKDFVEEGKAEVSRVRVRRTLFCDPFYREACDRYCHSLRLQTGYCGGVFTHICTCWRLLLSG